MKITEYKDIYERFLAKVEDEYLASLSGEQLHVALYPLLLSAINDFARISEHNLRKRDERSRVFYETLSEDEIEVLAILMKPIWLERYMNSSRKIEQQYLVDARKAKTEYTYKRVSIKGNFHGVEKAPKDETVYNENR